ncbi:MAG: TIGR00730 family Rossman fold protein [Thermoleophilia bacterium]
MPTTIRTVCVYAGSSPGADPAYAEAAAALGAEIARRGLGMVYGGGTVGLMGVAANAALAGGAPVTGIIPASLHAREISKVDLTELLVVGSMHERKFLMAERSDAFIALPGGVGTIEELVEALTWTQLGIHAKPVGVLDVNGYWEPLTALLDRARDERFVRPEHRGLLISGDAPGALLDALAAWEPRGIDKWMDGGPSAI